MSRKITVLLCCVFFAVGVQGQTTAMDPAARHAYSENTGWINLGPSNVINALEVKFDGTQGVLRGFAWGENIGWINFPTNGHGGVSINAAGKLSGYAWGENVGWIHFPTNSNGGVSINTASGEFSGYAWGENIGWIRFNSTNHGVRTLAFNRQGQGTPNWWLDHHRVGETHDAGDGVAAWEKYIMDVSPTNTGNGLVVTAITNQGLVQVAFAPASTRRFYTLKRTEDPGANPAWVAVPGQTRVAGLGTAQALVDTNAGSKALFAIAVEE